MSINVCAQEYNSHFQGIISVSFYRLYTITLFFYLNEHLSCVIERSRESVLTIKHIYEFIEAQ
jgi:hypothetical protein